MLKKILLAAVLAVATGAAGLYLFGEQLILKRMHKIALASLQGQRLAQLEDGLHVMLCGAGAPMPDPKRSGPCTLVIAGQQVLVFDIGSGAAGNIGPSGIPLGKVERVFLTHFHSDHIDGLGELSLLNWANGGRTEPLPVHGPAGVEAVVEGFNAAYSQDFGYRVAHHGPAIVPPSGAGSRALPFRSPADGELLPVFAREGLTVSAFRVTHEPIEPAVGYRVEYKGRSLLISGDTDKSDNLRTHARDVDLLIHEALSPTLVEVLREAAREAGQDRMVTLFDDILDYHTHPVEAAEIARDANAGHLLYHHIVPALPLKPMERIFLKGVSAVYDGPVTVGQDGTAISLPADSRAIRVDHWLPW